MSRLGQMTHAADNFNEINKTSVPDGTIRRSLKSEVLIQIQVKLVTAFIGHFTRETIFLKNA